MWGYTNVCAKYKERLIYSCVCSKNITQSIPEIYLHQPFSLVFSHLVFAVESLLPLPKENTEFFSDRLFVCDISNSSIKCFQSTQSPFPTQRKLKTAIYFKNWQRVEVGIPLFLFTTGNSLPKWFKICGMEINPNRFSEMSPDQKKKSTISFLQIFQGDQHSPLIVSLHKMCRGSCFNYLTKTLAWSYFTQPPPVSFSIYPDYQLSKTEIDPWEWAQRCH